VKYVLTFLDPLLGSSTFTAEVNHLLSPKPEVDHNESRAGEELVPEPLYLVHDSPGIRPALHPETEAQMEDLEFQEWSLHWGRGQVVDRFLKFFVGGMVEVIAEFFGIQELINLRSHQG